MRELIIDGTAFHAPANCNTLPHTLPTPAPQRILLAHQRSDNLRLRRLLRVRIQ